MKIQFFLRCGLTYYREMDIIDSVMMDIIDGVMEDVVLWITLLY